MTKYSMHVYTYWAVFLYTICHELYITAPPAGIYLAQSFADGNVPENSDASKEVSEPEQKAKRWQIGFDLGFRG